MTPTPTSFEVLPRDLSPYKSGNAGVDYVHRFESGRPGPHVLVNALTHGNEFCGMVAACHLLDHGVRPLHGTLTVSFANVAAYESFDPARPFDSRQITHNFNRIWSSDWLDGPLDSIELSRARRMRPVVAAADHILDIHSTSQDVVPFWVYPQFDRNAAVARALSQRPRTWSCRAGWVRVPRSSSTAGTASRAMPARRWWPNAGSISSRPRPTWRWRWRWSSWRTSG